jgi:hypothetical protein
LVNRLVQDLQVSICLSPGASGLVAVASGAREVFQVVNLAMGFAGMVGVCPGEHSCGRSWSQRPRYQAGKQPTRVKGVTGLKRGHKRIRPRASAKCRLCQVNPSNWLVSRLSAARNSVFSAVKPNRANEASRRS